MLKIGEYQTLKVLRQVDFGLYLGDGEEDVLMPIKYVSPETKIDDEVRVFVYRDSEDRPVATSLEPAGVVGDIVSLKVKDVNKFGAFMEWGLEKDLFVPHREMHTRFDLHKKYAVRVSLDFKTNRLIGISKLNTFINKDPSELEEGEKVKLIIHSETDLGYQAVINGEYLGLLYKSEVSKLESGLEIDGYIKSIREDGKIDLRLTASGQEGIDVNREKLLEALRNNEGVLELNDKSSPEEIFNQLGMSKKVFKKALGGLYKDKVVELNDENIRLKA